MGQVDERVQGTGELLDLVGLVDLGELTSVLIERVGEELGIHPLPARHQWPGDVHELARRFLQYVAQGQVARISEPGSIWVGVGAECARAGLDFETLAAGIRLSTRLTHGHVHRSLLAQGPGVDHEALLDLLDRIFVGGEEVVAAARAGYATAGTPPSAEDEAARRLGGVLLHGDDGALVLAHECGWDDDAVVCAIITSPESAAQIRRESECQVAYYPRSRDVVLLHPVAEDQLATTLRPLLRGHRCAVGPAVPMLDAAASLDLAFRAQQLGLGSAEATFADDLMLEIACSADQVVCDSLRRTYLSELDDLPSDQRAMLLATLLSWLRHWGHRPSVAEALGVHPQTVSHRINRLKDLLADELDEPHVRAELLVLLTAMSVSEAWQVP
ncbi:helix-turn-helix domain-containing protein [Janibacter terrae]|uniref:Helix-turn-helix domain-containing protein n=1 Tax=Janibacter terrae TaxID=103817 RepID=A0ABZ2FGI7_9MICO|nr:helix-turn-helix domain-containing protein [Janibacter terrae]MBA4085393.1 PucR family transcriptional regulator [Kytococcus sp.]HBO54221.1 PucR family transcriptional regulator [Janibacter terrae]HCE61278.1 PucR family transcriptional regulator [Janibacter terrae]